MSKSKDEHIENLIETMPQSNVMLTNESKEPLRGRTLLNEVKYGCSVCGMKLTNTDLLYCSKEKCPRNLDISLMTK